MWTYPRRRSTSYVVGDVLEWPLQDPGLVREVASLGRVDSVHGVIDALAAGHAEWTVATMTMVHGLLFNLQQ